MRSSRTLFAIAAAAALAAPQAAQAAPTLKALAPCYRSVAVDEREPIQIEASGFTPGASVDVMLDGITEATVTALEQGEVLGSVEAPYRQRGERPFTLTLAERGSTTNVVSAGSRVAALALRLKPKRAAPTRKVRFLGRGFIDGTEVFAHYLRGGKVRRTVSLGAPEGPCGHVDIRRRQFPIKRPKLGRWTLQVDNEADYTPDTVNVKVTINVRRALRGGP
jgi:hypothetical protein